jgi:hypothetical protein
MVQNKNTYCAIVVNACNICVLWYVGGSEDSRHVYFTSQQSATEVRFLWWSLASSRDAQDRFGQMSFLWTKMPNPWLANFATHPWVFEAAFVLALFSFSSNFLLVLKQSDPSRQILRYRARSWATISQVVRGSVSLYLRRRLSESLFPPYIYSTAFGIDVIYSNHVSKPAQMCFHYLAFHAADATTC